MDIKQIKIAASAPKQYNFGGGKIELHLNAPDGPMAGEPVVIVPSEATLVPGSVDLHIFSGITGRHDLYFVCKNDTAGASMALMTIMGLEFQDAAMAAKKAPEKPGSPGVVDNLSDYTGKYKFTGLPFETLEFVVENNQLVTISPDDRGPLTPTGTPDSFDAGGKAIFEFVRKEGKVVSVNMKPSGMSFNGVKQ